MANANIGITETTATAMAKISSTVQSFLIQESKMLPLVTDYSVLASKGTKSISLPRSPGFNAVLDKAENTTAVLDDTNAFSVDTISLNKHKYIQWLIEDFASVEAMVNVTENHLRQAAKQIALQMDNDILAAVIAGASSATPDHQIKYNDAVNEDIERIDILNARALFAIQNIDPRECAMVICPSQEKNMLNISDFIDASKFGSNEAITQGVIGKVYGMPVVVHNYLETAKQSVFLHPSSCGFASLIAPRVQREYDLSELGYRNSVDTIYGVNGALDSGKRAVVITETA